MYMICRLYLNASTSVLTPSSVMALKSKLLGIEEISDAKGGG